jgi:glycosyltransferase involved in cell wall biosynthesis
MMQDYKNYHIVYIDDNSPDQANEYVRKYFIEKNIPSEKVKIMINKERKGELGNIYYAGHNYCKLGEIMLIVEGNDALIGTNVLRILNALYQK